jgi:uncharacterized integral membrane protein
LVVVDAVLLQIYVVIFTSYYLPLVFHIVDLAVNQPALTQHYNKPGSLCARSLFLLIRSIWFMSSALILVYLLELTSSLSLSFVYLEDETVQLPLAIGIFASSLVGSIVFMCIVLRGGVPANRDGANNDDDDEKAGLLVNDSFHQHDDVEEGCFVVWLCCMCGCCLQIVIRSRKYRCSIQTTTATNAVDRNHIIDSAGTDETHTTASNAGQSERRLLATDQSNKDANSLV